MKGKNMTENSENQNGIRLEAVAEIWLLFMAGELFGASKGDIVTSILETLEEAVRQSPELGVLPDWVAEYHDAVKSVTGDYAERLYDQLREVYIAQLDREIDRFEGVV